MNIRNFKIGEKVSISKPTGEFICNGEVSMEYDEELKRAEFSSIDGRMIFMATGSHYGFDPVIENGWKP